LIEEGFFDFASRPEIEQPRFPENVGTLRSE
jgi:hypothetical protein